MPVCTTLRTFEYYFYAVQPTEYASPVKKTPDVTLSGVSFPYVYFYLSNLFSPTHFSFPSTRTRLRYYLTVSSHWFRCRPCAGKRSTGKPFHVIYGQWRGRRYAYSHTRCRFQSVFITVPFLSEALGYKNDRSRAQPAWLTSAEVVFINRGRTKSNGPRAHTSSPPPP